MKSHLLPACLILLATSPAAADCGKCGKEPDAMFTSMDKDKDGQVSQDEFLGRHREMLEKADANHDGKLSKEEMQGMREEMREKMGAKCENCPCGEDKEKEGQAAGGAAGHKH